MRGDDAICGSLFSYIDLEKRIRADHPLRVIRAIANAALKSLSGEFQQLYSPLGRESIPPERLLRALLLQAFYSIHSERQLVERIDHDLLFRWFVELGACRRPGSRGGSRGSADCWSECSPTSCLPPARGVEAPSRPPRPAHPTAVAAAAAHAPRLR